MEMTQEEMKQNILDWATDVSVAVESFARDIKFEMKKSTTEADLKEAKSSAKKLIEKIDEYLESMKPEFKVGDYVVDDGSYLTMKVDEASNSVVCSTICYNFRYFTVRNNFVCETGYLRHATPEEIKEYESALNFYKHGREPFEVKRGDVVYLRGYDKNIFLDSGNIYKKHNFVDGDVVLVKTAEEIDEWLGASDE